MFCGGIPVTKEHLWPDWLRRETRIREPFERRIEQETDGVETRDVIFMEPPFDRVVKAVCAACNNGWMSDVEAKAKPILLDLLYGKGGTLDRDDQHRLATWAALKACVFDALHPDGLGVPIEHRRRLYTYKKPAATGVAIWIGTYEAFEVCHYAHQDLKVARDGEPAPGSPNIYISTITAGALIVQVAGSLMPDLAFDELPLEHLAPELRVTKIWPARTNTVDFAQDQRMSHETLVGYTKMLYNVMGRLTGGAPRAR
jgi:hypothetical protein